MSTRNRIYLPHSYCALNNVELLDVVPAPLDLPQLAGAVVVRGKWHNAATKTEAFAVPAGDREPMEALRQLLRPPGAEPARVEIVAKAGDGSSAWAFPGWSEPNTFRDAGAGGEAIDVFLCNAIRPHMDCSAGAAG